MTHRLLFVGGPLDGVELRRAVLLPTVSVRDVSLSGGPPGPPCVYELSSGARRVLGRNPLWYYYHQD